LVGTLAPVGRSVCRKMNITKIKLQRSGLFISNAHSQIHIQILVQVIATHPALDSQRIEQAAPLELEFIPWLDYYKQAAPLELEFILGWILQTGRS
jgi:hypothetical protein